MGVGRGEGRQGAGQWVESDGSYEQQQQHEKLTRPHKKLGPVLLKFTLMLQYASNYSKS